LGIKLGVGVKEKNQKKYFKKLLSKNYLTRENNFDKIICERRSQLIGVKCG